MFSCSLVLVFTLKIHMRNNQWERHFESVVRVKDLLHMTHQPVFIARDADEVMTIRKKN